MIARPSVKLQAFEANDWFNNWAGSWSLLSCSHFIHQFSKTIIFGDHPFQERAVIIVRKGKSAGWMRRAEQQRLGEYFRERIERDPTTVQQLSAALHQQTDQLRPFLRESPLPTTRPAYEQFWERVRRYYQAHIPMKYSAERLPPDRLEHYLPTYEAARLYAEPVLSEVEAFVERLADQLGQQLGYDPRHVLCATRDELLGFFDQQPLPEEAVLTTRYEHAALLSDAAGDWLVVGSAVGDVEQLLASRQSSGQIRGQSAHPGIVRGTARIVFSPTEASHFNQGDILLTGMTRPEYLPLMKRAGAVVTDSGGVLSHAAIVARELQIPTIIGTQVATKTFKDGDLIEVNATAGIVRKIGL